MSMAAIGASVAGAAVSVGGGLLAGSLSGGGGGGGGGGGFNAAEAQKMLDEYVKNVRGQEDALWQQNAAFNTGYAQNVNALTDEFRNYINAYTKNYESQIAADNAALRGESDQALSELDRRSRETIDSTESRTLSLGDRFLEAAARAQRDYETSVRSITDRVAGGTPSVDAAGEASRGIDFNMQNLSNFARIADQLSQDAVQTRSRMLATADPRAAELSAIADENAAALMSGRISSDVQANLARSGAARALQGGFGGGSQMGRNLTARDLGLTSLDLMRQGTDMFDAQRRLNFATRVDGLQTNAANILSNSGLSSQQMLQTAAQNADRTQQGNITAGELAFRGAGSLLDSRVGSAESGRNFGGAAIGASGTQRLGLAGDLFTGRMNTANRVFDTNVAARNNVFSTNVNAAGRVYDRGAQMNRDIYGTQTGTASTVYGTMADVYGSVLQGQGSVMQQNMLNQQAQQASQNAMNASMIDTGAALAGNIFGSVYSRNRGGFNTASAAREAAPFSSSLSYTRGVGYTPVATALT